MRSEQKKNMSKIKSAEMLQRKKKTEKITVSVAFSSIENVVSTFSFYFSRVFFCECKNAMWSHSRWCLKKVSNSVQFRASDCFVIGLFLRLNFTYFSYNFNKFSSLVRSVLCIFLVKLWTLFPIAKKNIFSVIASYVNVYLIFIFGFFI